MLNSKNKKIPLKIIIIGFIIGVVLYLFFLYVSERLVLFNIFDGIPQYIVKRIPVGLLKCFCCGVLGSLLLLLLNFIKRRKYNE